MNEKRFITNDPYGYSRIFYNHSRLDNKKLCKKLNALVEENEQLKKRLAEREKMLDVRDKIIADVMKAVNGDVE